MPGQCVDHQIPRRAFEHALQQIAGYLALGFVGGLAGFVNVGALRFIAPDEAFLGHDLQEFQNAGVADRLLCAESFVDLANRRRPACPQHPQDFKLGGCRFVNRWVAHGWTILRSSSYCQRNPSYFFDAPVARWLAPSAVEASDF